MPRYTSLSHNFIHKDYFLYILCKKITIIRNKYTWKYLVVCNFIYNFAANLV